jgi:hypothetical protein
MYPMSMKPPGPLVLFGQKARSALGQARTIEAASMEKEVVCPAERRSVPEPSYLPGHLERIISTPPPTSIEAEIKKVHRRSVEHAETAAYRFTDARIYGGSVFSGGYRNYLKPFARPQDDCIEIGSAALISSLVGLQYFGHWLGDDMATHDLVSRDRKRLCLPLPGWPDIALYSRLLYREFETVENAFVKDLTLFRDFSQNSNKRARYHAMRSLLRSRVKPDGGADIVYLQRGSTGVSRAVENEDELAAAFEKCGIRLLSLERDSTKSILSALHGARIFITVEGSQQKHALYSLPERAGILLLQPPRRFNMLMKGFADCLDWPTGFVVGEDKGDNFRIDPAEVMQVVDMLQKRLK